MPGFLFWNPATRPERLATRSTIHGRPPSKMRDHFDTGLEQRGRRLSVHQLILESCLEIIVAEETRAWPVSRARLVVRPISSVFRADQDLLHVHGAERAIVDMTFVVLQHHDGDLDGAVWTK